MTVRHSTIEDIIRILEIFEVARRYMRSEGNMTQWGNGYPSRETIEKDIERHNSYVLQDGEEIIGTFAFIIGKDPSYATIEGCWINDDTYGTIHRIASDGTHKGVADKCLDFCLSEINNIRIDTHADNRTMKKWIKKRGFSYCGIIHVSDGSPRDAYQLIYQET